MSLKLATYHAWEPQSPPPDPRSASLDAIAAAVAEIVAAEGPITLALLIRRYIAAMPDLSRAGASVRARMRQALQKAVESGGVMAQAELGIDDEDHIVAHGCDQSAVRVRERSDRTFHEIPISELAGMLLRLRKVQGVSRYTESTQRAILHALELKRLTGATRERLLTAWRVSERWVADGTARGEELPIVTEPLPDNPAAAEKKRPAQEPADPSVPAWRAAMSGGPRTIRKQ